MKVIHGVAKASKTGTWYTWVIEDAGGTVVASGMSNDEATANADAQCYLEVCAEAYHAQHLGG